MENFSKFIDYDEGRDIDPREAFYAHALPCESCGEPVDERRPAPWDTDLQVGPCCYQNDSIPDVPVCAELLNVIDRCSLTSDVSIAMEAHRQCCETCRAVVELGRAA